jgi:two-component SAPR family response regulator
LENLSLFFHCLQLNSTDIRHVLARKVDRVLKIIVIDDDTRDMGAIKQILGSIPFVELAGCFVNPQTALKEMMENLPDVLITAIELTEMNGLSLTRTMQEVLASVHVILSSRSGHFAREAYDAGARGYIIKPYRKEKLMSLLEKWSGA